MSDEEFYTRPVFHVQDIGLSIDYFCEKLGFTKGWKFNAIAQVGRNAFDLILDADSDIPKASVPSVISLSVGDLDALHRDIEKRGAKIVTPPFAVDWQAGICQFDVQDLDGNVLVFWGDEA